MARTVRRVRIDLKPGRCAADDSGMRMWALGAVWMGDVFDVGEYLADLSAALLLRLPLLLPL